MGAVPVIKPGAVGTNERAPEARATLTRRVQFSATHRYHRPEWDDAVNNSVFGACAAPKPHGHDYSCDLTIAGTIDPHTGMVLDLGLLDRILDEEVVQPFHNRSLNDAAEFQPGNLIPTCEELARLIASRVGLALVRANAHGARVQRVRVAEDDTLSAEWAEPA